MGTGSKLGPVTPPAMKHWKDQYEDAAGAEGRAFSRLPSNELLDRVRHRQTGDYFALWDAIGRQIPVRSAGWVLFDFLLSDRPYLERYHCARVLLAMLQVPDLEAVDLSAGRPGQAELLEGIRSRLLSVAGPQPG